MWGLFCLFDHLNPVERVSAESVPYADMEGFAARMGEEEYVRRMRLEDTLQATCGQGQGKGIFRLERWISVSSVVKTCLQFSGLWSRAYRNYLDIQVEEKEWFFSTLPDSFDGFRILQLTDLHADLDEQFPAAVAAVVRDIDCDLAVVTGDFRACTFKHHSGATEASIHILKAIRAPIFLTLGNHDSLRKVPDFEAEGFPFLLNESSILERDGEQIALVGIDDPNFYRSHNFDHALKGVPKDCFKILLSHSPETYVEASMRGIDLLLAGHTHGGQICLPWRVPVVHDGSSPRHLLAGSWNEGNLQGYTGRGTGATGLPARLNCPAEVTLHILRRR